MLMPNVVLFIMLVFFSKPIVIIIANFFANDLKVYDIWVVVGQYSREIHDVLWLHAVCQFILVFTSDKLKFIKTDNAI